MSGALKRKEWSRELVALLSIGVPMGLTQLVQFSITTIDLLMIGRLGTEALAGASLRHRHLLRCVSLRLRSGPWPCRRWSVRRLAQTRTTQTKLGTRSGWRFWTIGLVISAMSILFFLVEEISLALGQPAIAAELAEPYVLALAPGLPFMLGTMALRNFLAALGRTKLPLFFIVLTTALNAFLNWLLIFGNLGFPRLELLGAGIASSVSQVAGFLILVVYMHIEKESRRFEVFKNFFVLSKKHLREVLQLSWPISISSLFEAMLFNACVFLMGRIGIVEMAAYQVALNVAATAFMMPFGLSMAGAVRVGFMAGAGDRAGIRRSASLSILCCIAAITIIAVPVFLSPDGVAALYLDTNDAQNTGLLSLVASFLPIAAAFALFDAIQVAANQALRGLKDVRVPMILTALSYWAIGFPISAYLGLCTSLGAVGVWWGLLAGLAAAAVLLGRRLFVLTRA